MATRRTSRPTAQRRPLSTHTRTAQSHYRRPLRFEPLEDRRLLALVTVNTLDDTVDLGDGLTSLREAIFATNTVPGADVIKFDFGHDGPAIIRLTQGELRITDSLTVTGSDANLLTIDASGNDPTPDINDGNGSRIFNIDDGTTNRIQVALSGLTLTGGDASAMGGAVLSRENISIAECLITGNYASTSLGATGGGGIFSLLGNLTVDGSNISDNSAAGPGGGIYAYASNGNSITIRDTTIAGNASRNGDGGGALLRAANGSAATMERTRLVGNTASRDGGGINFQISRNSSLQIADCVVAENVSNRQGGGLVLRVGQSQATVRTTTINNNSAQVGGGIWAGLVGGTATLEQITVSSNTANDAGGLTFSSDSPRNFAFIRHSTVTNNSAIATTFEGTGGIRAGGQDLTLSVEHTIVAGNQIAAGTKQDFRKFSSLSLVARNSIFGNGTGTDLGETAHGVPDANGNLIGGPMNGLIDPLLGPLADNGGPTLTHALHAGSPAINAGDLNAQAGEGGVPLYDQRGEPFGRVFGGRIDIGAFEYQAPSDLNLLVDTLVDESDGNYARGDLSLREAIELANLWPSTDTIHFDPDLTAAGPATILLTKGELKITDSLTITGPSADLLTVDASGNDPTPAENNGDGSGVFNIFDGNTRSRSDVTISGLRLTGADIGGAGGAIISSENLILRDSTISGNSAGVGAGIYNRGYIGGKLTIIRSMIQDNSASSRGGGIFANLGSDSLAISGSHILGNSAGSDGGGLFFQGFRGQAEVTDSVVVNNKSSVNGGGISGSAGAITINRTTVRDNWAGRSGGGIAASGNITVSNSSIVGNSAVGGVIDPSVSGGGGIAASGNLVISNTTISGNSSNNVGGGIWSYGTANITACTINDNSAITAGGGIRSGIGNLTVTNSTISGNSASGGGGVSFRGALVVTNSVITSNSASGSISFARHGGGIWSDGELVVAGSTVSANSSAHDGGGIWGGLNSNVTITNSTVSGNSAVTGGGVWVAAGASIAHTTIVYNGAQVLGGGLFSQSGPLELQHSIVARNSAPAGRDATGLIGTTIDSKMSLISWNAQTGLVEAQVGAPDANGNLIGGPIYGAIDPLLGPLVNNGGPTMTHALSPGSPATNTGDPTAVRGVGGVPLYDQRGYPFSRVFGGRIDIGAFEAQPNPLPGDYDFNGVVDAADAIVWRETRGSTTDLRADGNEDGVVDEADRAIWMANFGKTRSGELVLATFAEMSALPTRQPQALPGVRPAFIATEATTREKTKPPADFGELSRAEPGADTSRPVDARRNSFSPPRRVEFTTPVNQDAALVAWLTLGPRQDEPRYVASNPRPSFGESLENAPDADANVLDCVFDEVGTM